MRTFEEIEKDFNESYYRLLKLYSKETETDISNLKYVIEPFRLHTAKVGDKFYFNFKDSIYDIVDKWKLCTITYIRSGVMFYTTKDVVTGEICSDEEVVLIDSMMNTLCLCFKEVAEIPNNIEYVNLCPYTEVKLVQK